MLKVPPTLRLVIQKGSSCRLSPLCCLYPEEENEDLLLPEEDEDLDFRFRRVMLEYILDFTFVTVAAY